jgi:hypothetical protein
MRDERQVIQDTVRWKDLSVILAEAVLKRIPSSVDNNNAKNYGYLFCTLIFFCFKNFAIFRHEYIIISNIILYKHEISRLLVSTAIIWVKVKIAGKCEKIVFIFSI